jgi:hypothetical protein
MTETPKVRADRAFMCPGTVPLVVAIEAVFFLPVCGEVPAWARCAGATSPLGARRVAGLARVTNGGEMSVLGAGWRIGGCG